jgi:potassium efflux system protein
MLNQELVSMPLLVELATVQREATAERLERTRALMQRLEAKVNRKRQTEATKSVDQAEEAMRQVADSPAVLQQAAAVNTTLGDKLQLVTAALERTTAEKDTLDKESKKIEENFKNTKQKIEFAGLSQALGLMLHERRRTLPDTRLLQKKKTLNEQEIAEAGLLQMQSAEERKELEDFDAYVTEHAIGSSPDELKKIEPELRGFLNSRIDLLDKIITSNHTYLGVLAELELLYRNYITIVVSFDSFLAERLVWVRSMPLLRLKDFNNLPHEIAALLAPGRWLVTGKTLIDQVVSSPILILVCMLTVFLMWCKSRMRARLKTAVYQAGNPASYRFALPLQAFGLTVLLALPGPLLLMTLGWQVHTLAEITDFTRVVAMGLIIFSYRFFLLRVFRILLLPEGLAAGFFLWPKATVTLLRREAGLMMVTFLPAIFFTNLAFFIDFRAGGSHILGRLLFIVALSFMATFIYRILHPRTGVWHRFVKDHSDRLLARLYPFFFFVSMFLPLMLIGLIIAGYVFAVGAFIRCLINSVWVAIVLLVCHQMVERWLIQSSRRLSLRQAPNRRAQAQAKADQGSGQLVIEKEFGLVEEPAEVPVELSAESRKLLDTVAVMSASVGLWLVWADVLPALRIFNEFTLWKYGAVVNGQTTLVPVTLADAGLTVLIGIITLTATRHFPSLLKIVLLQHLDISAGSRYTATTLSRYLIGGTGLMAIANILGFSWSQIQWLVAALGVGIGFGLQEIVANFISGIIILFERPIRVGDVVTIGTTDGVVTKIRIRATTIRDYDRKELLVPNKEFISGRLLNWSLSDPVIRVLIPVGIAYGSDVQTAMNLMLQAANDNALVLDDPKPVVTFDSFGDNALMLTLRCFIGSVDNRVPAKSGLHQVIDQKFREAAISMAFPQRDVHLDTNKPLDIRVVHERGTTLETAFPAGNNNQN